MVAGKSAPAQRNPFGLEVMGFNVRILLVVLKNLRPRRAELQDGFGRFVN